MVFGQNDILHLPELADQCGLASPHFRVDAILRGGMGECVRVTQGERAFALKVIQADLVEDPNAWSRYLREVRLWTTLSACEGVVEALRILRINDLPVVCSRWMSGGNLRRHLRNCSPELFYATMARIVGTLRWAYDRHQMIHRDLKPDNILLDEAGRAYLSDWGLARPLAVAEPEHHHAAGEKDAPPALTVAGSFLGTVYYASPEQLLGVPLLDHRTDIYSLGCLMYEWETGAWPFTGSTADEVRLKHLFQAPAPIAGFLRKSTFGADQVILACLEKEPARRPRDYASLDLALADSAKHRGLTYESFRPSLRYEMPMVGAGEYERFMRSGQTGIRNQEGTYAVVEQSDLEQYMREAQALSAVGDFDKAVRIYGSLFIPQMVSAVPDYPHNQHVTINYADCLIALGRAEEAIRALGCLANAKEKPAEYFVNLSLAQIKHHDFAAAAATASEGLRNFQDDQDLVGNLLIAQTAMRDFARATETAKTRLSAKRDVHSLLEVAALHCKYAGSIRELDWPLAVKNLEYAVRLLREAKELNPRFLPVRLQLPIALQDLTAYTQCSDEIGETKDLPMHVSDRVFLASLFARCLDGLGAHQQCWEFCDGWLKRIDEVQATNHVPRHNVVNLERARATTIADGYCIGRMRNGQRVIAPAAAEFFAHIVRDAELREAGDFCYLARLHEWMEEYDQAYDVLNDGESLYPEYWEFTFNRAAFRLRVGDHRGALPNAERSTVLAPWKAQSWRLLAKTLEENGRPLEAESANTRAEEVQRIREELVAEIDKV
jgi:tetratricopeptide (TPR) repeat protein